MSNIPEGRLQLLLLANRVPSPYGNEIRAIVDKYLIRSSPVRRAKVKSKKVTPAIAKAVRKLSYANPYMHEADIAAIFKINPGRVSEILTGKKK